MKKIKFLFIFLIVGLFAKADEGFWLPYYLQQQGIIDSLHKKGCKLSAKEIFDLQQTSLKDAVVIFGGGCTGEVISTKGLVLTNYHCGVSYVQKHSTVENNYLENGFWAYSLDQELPNPGLSVKFLIYMEDVTDKILKNIDENTPEKVRNSKIKENSKALKNKFKEKYNEDYYAIEIVPFYQGNQYFLFVYEVYKDVRLVGAPPSTIGKFGGDSDNWIWPRHTGDFMLFRIYVDKNNKPAEYSPENIPLKPKKYLKIARKNIRQGQFTMVLGYPGSSSEYIPSYGVENIVNVIDPLRIKIRDKKLAIIKVAMKKNKELEIKYISKESSISNGWKKWQGEISGVQRLKLIQKKREFEKKFQNWTQTNPEAKKYKNLLSDFQKYYKEILPYEVAYYMWVEAFYFSDLRKIFVYINKNLEDKDLTEIKNHLIKLLKDFDYETEKAIFDVSLKFFKDNVEPSLVEDYIKRSDAQYIFEKSQLVKVETIKQLKSKKQIQDDILVEFYQKVFNYLYENIYPYYDEKSLKLDSLNRIYMKAQMEMQKNKVFYPDANFTMRLAYGEVKGFEPKDAIYYRHYTTIKGIFEKEMLGNYDYKVPPKLTQLYENKDFGNYLDDKNQLRIAFIATNHTSGGNSGSPVLDENGNLIGVNFDRVWEGTMSDLVYDIKTCRNIVLDINYVLFMIDKYANAQNILKELEFAN